MTINRLLITFALFSIFFIGSCESNKELLKKIENMKGNAMSAKQKAESKKGQVLFGKDFDKGNSKYGVAESAFQAEEYDKSLTDYTSSYYAYTRCYEKAKKSMNKAKGAIDNADMAIKDAEKTAQDAEAEQATADDNSNMYDAMNQNK